MENFKDVIVLDENRQPDRDLMRREKIKETLRSIGAGIKKGASETWNFIVDNKENLAFIVPIGMTVIGGLSKLKKPQVTGASYRENLMYYDRQDNSYWQLKRQLRNSEMAELRARRRNGENPEDILYDMGLLK